LFLAETYDSVFTYGNSYQSSIRLANIKSSIAGSEFDINIAGKNIHIQTKLIGSFNVENICAAI
jgi:UDP-N-acetylmuramyl pentapeptide synthase